MEISLLIFGATEYLKESEIWLKLDMPDPIKNGMSEFMEFLKTKVLVTKESIDSLNDFLRTPADSQLKDSLGVRIQKVLEEKPKLLLLFEEKIEELKRLEERNLELQSRIGDIVVELEDMKDDNPGLHARFDKIIDELEVIKRQTSLIQKYEEYSEHIDPQSGNRKKRPRIIVSQRGKNLILVPYDFTPISEFALQHAIKFAKTIGGPVSLLHLVKKDKDIAPANQKLKEVVEATFEKYELRLGIIVRTGNIFTDITKITYEYDAKVAFMGTHGIKGMQKVTGSWALKVIADSITPFLIVQAPPKDEEFKNVLFPVDYRFEMKQKLNQAVFLAQYYDLKFVITKPASIASQEIMKRTIRNLKFTQRYFKQHNIDYEIHTVERTNDFAEATLNYISYAKPDLVLITTTKNIGLQDYLLGADEQKIIANEAKIPVMCVNPIFSRQKSFGESGSFLNNA